MSIHILGIRHHGPGSARNVRQFLEELQPDIVLVEGPPEADGILEFANHAELKPPVAILCYQPDDPERSSFYPFAEFSPEWQAIQFARKNNIHVRFMDLPAGNSFALRKEEQREQQPASDPDKEGINNYAMDNSAGESADEEIVLRKDPMSYLAEAAGYEDGEKWWEQMFEHRLNNEAVFEAVNESMQVLREHFPKTDRRERLREAYMRKVIRQAEKEMFHTIAVICGAWHAPALINMPKQKDDNDLLKNLPKVKVECTWIPWTYNRLSYFSGYGAGINSPGWYEHIWHHPDDDGTLWMAKVAQLFRSKQMDTSVAHIIEAVRLANSLASLRHRHKAGLEELNEATLSVLCNGENVLLSLVHHELIVSDKIGEIPESIPRPPLQLDIERTQKRLRLPATADWKDYTLDLRKENDLERSIFLHRLALIDIAWGRQSTASGKGTFKEQWRLQWDPEFSIHIIEKGTYGNTVEDAASAYVIEKAGRTSSLTQIAALLENTIPAELPFAVEQLITQVNNLAAASGDVAQLMEVIPNLVNISRYGNVRRTDAEMVLGIIQSMITRICVSLPVACTGIDDDAAQHLLDLFFKLNEAITLLQNDELTKMWQQMLTAISGSLHTAPVIAGYSLRLLSDYKLVTGENLVKAFYYAMSSASSPDAAASWLEGFLKGSGTLLLVDEDLWSLVNEWLRHLDEKTFTQVLPLLRRTFANFTQPERRKLGEKVRAGGKASTIKIQSGLDEERAAKGIGVVLELMGYRL
ncbi:MAG: hypothetical protein DI535_14705 [Citrobacter freundii]|nr:MAG: hypothetical protein DI535_14705 [Citrobacter freundii]